MLQRLDNEIIKKKKEEKFNTDLVIIPGGMMSWVEVLIVTTNSFSKITLKAI